MASLKALVTSVAVNEIRDVYDRYQITMSLATTGRIKLRIRLEFHEVLPDNFVILETWRPMKHLSGMATIQAGWPSQPLNCHSNQM